MRIPMLAIHLYREIYDAGFKPNKQEHLAPVLATALKAEVNKDGEKAVDGEQVPCLSDHVRREGLLCSHILIRKETRRGGY